MTKIYLIPAVLFGLIANGIIQLQVSTKDNEKVIIDNDKLTVTEFVSNPGNNVCGTDMHSHEAHLTIVLTDAFVSITASDGKSQNLELKVGDTFWFEPETHQVLNIGDQPVKMLLINLKE
jgi:quercetin dioxygenase-like cupin family protein